MASKQIALGSILKIDPTGHVTFTAMTLVRQITPPPRSRKKIEGLTLGDTFEVSELGIESESEMEFQQLWHPGDTEHEKLDTLFGSKNEFGVQLVTAHTTPVTLEFTVKVVSLEPEAWTVDGVISRKVTLVRTSAITRTP
jgi:hypothetical protein